MLHAAVEAALSKLYESGLAFPGDLKGCTEEEILSIEDHFQVRLPESYRDFLSLMGRSAGDFLVGSGYAFPEVLEFRKDAEELLRDRLPDFKLDAVDFVFFHHQGYTFEWFRCCDRADDPPVSMFTDSEKEPRIVRASFSDWLLRAVEEDIEAYRELDERERR
jgi:hypothetical protein